MGTQNNYKHTATLIIKFLKNELTGQEALDFERWLNASMENRELVESFRNTKDVQKEISYLHGTDIDGGWAAISSRITERSAKRMLWSSAWKYSAAAVLLITVGFGAYKYSQQSADAAVHMTSQVADVLPGSKKAILNMADGSEISLNESSLRLNGPDKKMDVHAYQGLLVFNQTAKTSRKGYNTVKTPRAGEYRMILPDGTKIWLNAASSIAFATDFNKTNRKVILKGEAYFEVAHNKALPFKVDFNETEVEVLGTHFNISSFGGKSRTTLIQGSIKITEAGKKQMLMPGESASVEDGALAISQANMQKSIAWTEGTFYFDGDTMPEIMNQIFRWYDVEVKYKGKAIEKKYSGNIRRQATLKQTLEMLNAVSGIKFSLEDRTVTVDYDK